MLLSNLRQRVTRNEGGFTLIELLVVLIIIAVLLAIAVPSYLKFKERAEERAAASNVRSAIPAAEAWYSDHTSYTGMDAAGALLTIDSGLKVSKVTVTADGKGYCIASTHNGTATGKAVHKLVGPGGSVVAGDC